ncbi:RES domain-containing protein [Burkholderia lata]|uniref:RES domain-containing protein n=1 Tax=Burkholderia lata (strain ATCC 17760 / DSM 23089 / LMG 22485 / NCIMB 9086 / R18194 / 383) TaxID=482957 RepID=A0A6P2V212_BURL3|nr:RES family NAD+ phosphorylase [Burkholderia lata]VWC82150.1 RES domain-containing protein [Burkholderia lata]
MKQTHVRETAYRAHAPKWAFQPISGAGAALNGGRLNRPGVDAFYVSLDLRTACDEYKGISPILPPATLVEYTLDLGPVVDFSGGYTAEWEPIWSELYCDWKALALNDIEPPSWVIGDIVRQLGIKGILFRSAVSTAPTAFNLVLYLDNLAVETDVLRAHAPAGTLPQDQSSWSMPT